MSKGFDMLRDYIEHDALCMRRRKCCDFEYELQQEFAALESENDKLRELVKAFDWCTENFDLPCKCDSCPLGQSDKLTPECEVRMRELGIGAK